MAIWTIPFGGIAVSTAVDIEVTHTRNFIVHEIVFGQSSDYGDAEAKGVGVTIKRGVGHTAGSGGTTLVSQLTGGYVASGGPTGKAFNTTQASAGAGTLSNIRSDGVNLQAGYQYLSASKRTQISYSALSACVISITAPSAAVTMYGTIVVEDI